MVSMCGEQSATDAHSAVNVTDQRRRNRKNNTNRDKERGSLSSDLVCIVQVG